MTKILVVDDDVIWQKFISEILTREGYEIEICPSGVEAVEKLEKGGTYDLILTDLIMPELDGMGVLNHLRSKEDTTPVIVLSGGGVTLSSEDAIRSVEGMVAGVLEKPVQYQELVHKIKTVLEES